MAVGQLAGGQIDGHHGLSDFFCCHLPMYYDGSLSESFVD
jgi:hypothetical protein